MRSIEVLGEAAKQVPESIRSQHPEIPWRLLAGMRDRLIHRYFGVDYDIVWDVAAHEAPRPHQRLEEILGRLAP